MEFPATLFVKICYNLKIKAFHANTINWAVEAFLSYNLDDNSGPRGAVKYKLVTLHWSKYSLNGGTGRVLVKMVPDCYLGDI